MNEAPDYSATYVTIATSGGMKVMGLPSLLGVATSLCRVNSLAPLLIGQSLDAVFGDLGKT